MIDVIGGRNGVAHNVYLDTETVDLSGIRTQLPDKLANVYATQSFKFKREESSYVEIPNISMGKNYTYIAFVKADGVDGPLWQWNPPGMWGDHLWIRESSILYYTQEWTFSISR